MALELKATNGYGPIFWENVLDEIRRILRDSSDYGTIYIGPEYKNIGTQSIRLWGDNAETVNLWQDKWVKRYNVNLSLYMITQSQSENFYKNFYQESERIYQIMYNNKISTGTSNNWYGGEVDEIVYNELEDNEEQVDGLNKATFDFSCLVGRTTTATINT